MAATAPESGRGRSAVSGSPDRYVRSGPGGAGSVPAAPTHPVHGSLAVPAVILPPIAPKSGDGGGQALIPGLVTPEDLAKPALALQEFNETIERDMADLIDFDTLDAAALGSSIAEFLAGPVTPSVAPSALPARVMHGDDIAGEPDSLAAAPAIRSGSFLPVPPTAGRSEDIAAMVPASMLKGNRPQARVGVRDMPVQPTQAPSRFDRAGAVQSAPARRTPPMAPVTLPPPLSFAQSARPVDQRRAAPMPPPPGSLAAPAGSALPVPTTPLTATAFTDDAVSLFDRESSTGQASRSDSVARLTGFDQLLGRSTTEQAWQTDAAGSSFPAAAPSAAGGEADGTMDSAHMGRESRFPLPALPPTTVRGAVAAEPSPDQSVEARTDGRLDMASGIDTLTVRVRDHVREDMAGKAVLEAPRPNEARLYELPEAPVQARKGSITDFQPTIAKPKAIVRDEDSDLIVVPANGVGPATGKAPRRLAAAKPAVSTAAGASAAPSGTAGSPSDGKLQAGQVESIRIPPNTNIPLPPGLFDEEELAELERRGYRVERPVVKARDEDDGPASAAINGPDAGKKPAGTSTGPAEKAAASSAGPESAANRTAAGEGADSSREGGPPALSPNLFRNRKKPVAEAGRADEAPEAGEEWEWEPVTGFTPVRGARKLFNSIVGR
ncbi:MAG: hypothetical protein LIQ30_06720 [Planctomycetes bacterium]|nr:hypothetical protein [Planctomycetota bacterium]